MANKRANDIRATKNGALKKQLPFEHHEPSPSLCSLPASHPPKIFSISTAPGGHVIYLSRGIGRARGCRQAGTNKQKRGPACLGDTHGQGSYSRGGVESLARSQPLTDEPKFHMLTKDDHIHNRGGKLSSRDWFGCPRCHTS